MTHADDGPKPRGERQVPPPVHATSTTPATSAIFVFGSNEAGRHGKGAAAFARTHYGAQYGQGWGLQGQSFAIPTKDAALAPLPLARIAAYVARFCAFAREHPELTFRVTRIGCGLAGYQDWQIAPMFHDAPPNCELPDTWADLVSPRR